MPFPVSVQRGKGSARLERDQAMREVRRRTQAAGTGTGTGTPPVAKRGRKPILVETFEQCRTPFGVANRDAVDTLWVLAV